MALTHGYSNIPAQMWPWDNSTLTPGDVMPATEELVRKFETGATRSAEGDKPDYEGFLSPAVIEEFGRYMTRHRVQPDGSIRASDNWQKGIPLNSYMKSGFRHFIEAWTEHRAGRVGSPKQREALMALFFNVQGYTHELLKLEE